MTSIESQKAEVFVEYIKNTVDSIAKRIQYRTKRAFVPTLVDHELTTDTLWLTFGDGKTTQQLTFPIPQRDCTGNLIIQKGHVKRACGTWMIGGQEKPYWEIMLWATTQRVEEYFPTSSKRVFIERLLRSFEYGSSSLVFRNFQRIVDDLVNKLPLVGTDMQTWAMCNRIQILDPKWDGLTPREALEYQTELNKRMFPWTSLGQSDSGMCNNTLLKTDVRATVPFGLAHHNPRRNLYQTLGMTGDEAPSIMSQSEKALAEKGIIRKGWNLMTAFVDMPANFEDQIIVNSRLSDLFVTEKRSFTCHGTVLVDIGEPLKFLAPLSIEPDGCITRFDLQADSAEVSDITDEQINFNGQKTDVKVIEVKLKRLFKDGLKLTNRHGNKGIIFMADTGTVDDPLRGQVPVDVIVSAKSVQKRKNFGQLIEALATLVNGPDKEMVVDDTMVAHTDRIKQRLVEKGYREDGTLDISTQWGTFKGVCGWVHWGCIKTPEDQVWTRYDTLNTNSKDLRTAGNKVSHIEMRALVTIFGQRSSIIKEIISHWQGHDEVFESLRILDTLKGEEVDRPVINWDGIDFIDQSTEFFHDLADLSGTISDTELYSQGVYFMLPDDYVYTIKEGSDVDYVEEFKKKPEVGPNEIALDKILIPPAFMRRPWKHQSGKYGITETAAAVNNILTAIHRYKNEQGEASQIGRTIYMYFHGLSNTLSTKRGLISNYCMSVRYPSTVKATAAVSELLEPNEIEIHERMAKDLKVNDGDYVLVERFPCLGFMSLRTQRVKTTTDPNAKFVIRVSGSSLSSQALDFDGDVLYLMSFHSPEAKAELEKEFHNPHPRRKAAYEQASNKKVPEFRELGLDDYNVEIFPKIDPETNASIVCGLTGIKRGTGTIIALCYNIMRILEREVGYQDENMSVALELLLDKVANSVFSMKHAGRSLEKECREAILCADVEKMLALDFNPEASALLSQVITNKAKEMGIAPSSLPRLFAASENGRSSIVNMIIRRFHKVWFTSRSNQHPVRILDNINRKPEDLSGWLFRYAKNRWEEDIGLHQQNFESGR